MEFSVHFYGLPLVKLRKHSFEDLWKTEDTQFQSRKNGPIRSHFSEKRKQIEEFFYVDQLMRAHKLTHFHGISTEY